MIEEETTIAAEAQDDLITEYLSLDPNGEFFINEGIEWNYEFNEPVATEFICKIPFARLLGERPDVPLVEDEYVPLADQAESIRAAMLTGLNVALSGPPGSGKSSVVQQIAARLNRPFYVADIHEEYRPELFFGETRPTNGRELQWQDGPLTKAFKNKGSFFLMDEAKRT